MLHTCYTPKFHERLECGFECENIEKKIGVCFLIRSTLGIKKARWSFEMGIRTSDNVINYSCGCAQTK
jgi:hypothetical protein